MATHRTFASRPKKVSWQALLALFFAFMCLPSILAAAGEAPTSSHAEAGIAHNLPALTDDPSAIGLAPGDTADIVITERPATLTVYLHGNDESHVARGRYRVALSGSVSGTQ